MGFLDKMKNKIENNVTDKIVDKMFGKQKKDAEEEIIKAQQEQILAQQELLAKQAAAQNGSEAAPQVTYVQQGTTMEDVEKARMANAMSPDQMNQVMGIMYNTKRCPNCQAVCMNSPAECPYCHADLKSVKPMTPEELEKLS